MSAWLFCKLLSILLCFVLVIVVLWWRGMMSRSLFILCLGEVWQYVQKSGWYGNQKDICFGILYKLSCSKLCPSCPVPYQGVPYQGVNSKLLMSSGSKGFTGKTFIYTTLFLFCFISLCRVTQELNLGWPPFYVCFIFLQTHCIVFVICKSYSSMCSNDIHTYVSILVHIVTRDMAVDVFHFMLLILHLAYSQTSCCSCMFAACSSMSSFMHTKKPIEHKIWRQEVFFIMKSCTQCTIF